MTKKSTQLNPVKLRMSLMQKVRFASRCATITVNDKRCKKIQKLQKINELRQFTGVKRLKMLALLMVIIFILAVFNCGVFC
jgi:hypothetical protein